MRMPIMLTCVAACVFAGCAYKAENPVTGEDFLKIEYRGNIDYAVVAQPMNDWKIAEFRIWRKVNPGSEYRECRKRYEMYAPYHPLRETANFAWGLYLAAWIPIEAVFMLPAWEKIGLHVTPRELFLPIAYNLNIFRAKPDIPENELYDVWWPAPLRKGYSKPYMTEWAPCPPGENHLLPGTVVEITIDSLCFKAKALTDENGLVKFNIRKLAVATAVPEGADIANVPAMLTIIDEENADGAESIPVTIRVYCKNSGTRKEAE